jgi:gliding motility-associated-like protein
MKKIPFLYFLLFFTNALFSQQNITLTHNVGTTPVKTNITTCDFEEYWARTFTLSTFGISTTEQFIIKSGQVAISNSQKGAELIFNVYSIDENFPNSLPKTISYGNLLVTPKIDNTPEILQIDFKTPIVIPSGVKKILIEVTQLHVLSNGVKKIRMAGTKQDNDVSWIKGCRKNYSYIPTDKLDTPVPDANFYINLTGEKTSIINSKSNVVLSHNDGDDVKKINMFSCTSSYQYWSRRFVLSDFGVTKNEELIITKGNIALFSVGWLPNFQFNIYKIDKNFPSSFNKNDLIGSSQTFKVPPFSFNDGKAKIIATEFDKPITIPADVEMILVEVHKGIEYGDGHAFIGGTDNSNDVSWYRGCNGHSSGEHRTTDQLSDDGLAYWTKGINFFITVNGEPKTILPFEINNNKNCSGDISDFSLTNITNIKSVVWDFNDPSSGTNNTSNNIDTSHIFSTKGTYKVIANVEHIDGEKYVIEKEIEVLESPIINSSVSLKQCDDDIDGFSLFNLTEVNSKIVPNPSDYTITYFEQKNDAETNNAPIININTYRNKSASNDKIWARVENSNSCYRISEVDLIVSTTQIPTSFKKKFFVCDNGLDITDGIATFDFSSSTEEIKNIFPANQQLIISYYSTLADALSESNSILNISSFQNTNSPNQQIIYTRVDSVLDNECLGLGPHIILNVDKIPKANPIIISPVCDTDRDGLYSFDTSTFQNMLIGNQNNVEVIYFDQKGNTLPSPLPNPFITATQKVTARVTNSLSQDPLGKCSDETIINFVVNSVPLANPVTPQIVCDTDFDGIYSFDTSLIHNTILGGQTNIKVSYFDDNGNALSNPLPNPFITASTEITVRLENLIQPTCYDETIVSFVVREKPYFELIEEAIICMDNDPKLNLSIENPAENYSYEWTDENAIIKSNSSNFIATKGGVYTVVATNQFGCVSEKKQVLVTESSRAQLKSSDIKIIEDSENNSIQVLTENLGFGSYEFRLKDFNGTILVDYQNSPIFNNLIGGIYILEVNDKNGCGYISKNVSILSFPKFFTPNNDGINDTWQVKGIGKNYYTKGRVIIFNRFGKNLFDFSIFDRGWDGNYFGKKLPSNDYWFSIRLMDIKGVLRIRNGSFSLIRK